MDASAETTTSLGDRLLRARESGILLFTVYLVLFLYWYTGETFWTAQNLLNVARNVSFVTIMGIGQALKITPEMTHGATRPDGAPWFKTPTFTVTKENARKRFPQYFKG
jgi:hypothetical protein